MNFKFDNFYINVIIELYRSFDLGGLFDVIFRDIFFFEFGGSMNNSSDMDEMRIYGMMMLKL